MGACTRDTGGLYFLSTEHTPISLSPRCSPSQAQLLHLVKARLRPFRLPGEYQQRLCITGATERQMGRYLRGWQRCVVGDQDDEDFGLARCINLGKDMAIRHSQRDTTRKHYDLTVVYVESTSGIDFVELRHGGIGGGRPRREHPRHCSQWESCRLRPKRKGAHRPK
ncbi:hypothetical protein ARMGADRAFT_824611 [Armillaria gallica]|uniref:Uncharacterized protein n=1 Tax=Armillaria gallica TaxID=47427 RepID=A0A2H3CVD8_ARMGA|nr:hypothetical protein ARMGADRAFT_824611 [Armillaria gallica]